MTHKVTLIPGDGIGPEVTNATVRILEATGVKFEWETFAVGAEAYEKSGEYIPKDLIESLERTHVGLKVQSLRPWAEAFPASTSPCARSSSSMRTSVPFAICPIFLRAIPMST